ncbi:unnamed protein product (macronuclear) [Paramecium tetraurelia]|uniref:Telomeric single stranded DNA binding POT1/Cdc13 domain-containing protein n=1 Tax=Paramecium tetraurelia TaxID=5888 RepID=A0CKN4_PARTE|nr:uncharacterized protein GSPATT00001065001 [Paramecium tetraurelia]CAK71351.1 unnamed protein product [Paramecium tetraurelia]|eukprot:XP_001438748.1 hypothetical protein (macronuclear) [Paramecium tetraurelia strain d4-2]
MSLKEIVTIQNILEALQTDDAEKQLRKKKLFAFIIDASKPKRLHGQGDYMQMIKIMDDSYNGYLTLFYFFKSLSEAAPLDTIGDIVFLKRYHYQLFNGEPQGRRNSFKTSYFLLFDANTLELKFNPQDSTEPSNEELLCIQKISNHSQSYLAQTSLINLYWYGVTNAIYDGLFSIQELKDENVVQLRDSKNDQYTLLCQGLVDLEIQEGAIIKLRNIQISNENEILITDKTNIMLLPNFCYDVQHFEEINQVFPKIDFQQENYQTITIGSFTQIKKKYENQQYVPLINLIQKQVKESIIVVQGQVQSIYPTSVEEAFIFYNKFKSFSYKEVIANGLQISGLQKTLQIQINIRDASLEGTTYVIQLLIFDNPSFFPFPLVWDNVEYMQAEYQKLLEKLILEQDQTHDFVLEVIESPESTIYRVIDTKVIY